MNTSTYLSLGMEDTYTDPTFLFNEVERAIQIEQSPPDFVVQVSPYVDFGMGAYFFERSASFQKWGFGV